MRQAARLTYTALAQRSRYSTSAVHAADQGHVLPGETLTESFVRACDGDVEDMLDKRKRIATALQTGRPTAGPRPTPKTRGLAPPDPTEATNPVAYIDALKKLREWSGMTYREIQAIAADYARPLPMSTVCAALSRGTLPQRDLTASFVRAVGMPEADQLVWLAVRDALATGKPVARGPAWKRWAAGSRRPVPGGAEVPAHEDVVAIEDGVVPISHLTDGALRDWVLVDGRWRSTDDLQSPRRRESWPARVTVLLTRWRRRHA
ncbi:hypothetical protein ACQP2P_10790 [Dactylosporangium sp. CA-139114]|uniref:hypothetical protein n=1 Tax=Dactylosporangium sp. CA-139114 TaxID=3239931 RepID=UPI003D965F28